MFVESYSIQNIITLLGRSKGEKKEIYFLTSQTLFKLPVVAVAVAAPSI